MKKRILSCLMIAALALSLLCPAVMAAEDEALTGEAVPASAEPETAAGPELTAGPEAAAEPEDEAAPEVTVEPEETAEPENEAAPEAASGEEQPQENEPEPATDEQEAADAVPSVKFSYGGQILSITTASGKAVNSGDVLALDVLSEYGDPTITIAVVIPSGYYLSYDSLKYDSDNYLWIDVDPIRVNSDGGCELSISIESDGNCEVTLRSEPGLIVNFAGDTSGFESVHSDENWQYSLYGDVNGMSLARGDLEVDYKIGYELSVTGGEVTDTSIDNVWSFVSIVRPDDDAGQVTLTLTKNETAEEIDSGTCGADGDNVKWVLTDDGVLTISGTGKMEEFDGDAPWRWGYNASHITKVIIQSGVTSVGSYSFRNYDYASGGPYDNLTEVSLPDSITSIGEYAFYLCTALKDVTIPQGVTTIGERAFYVCNSLTSINIPSSVTAIGENAFSSCQALTSISAESGNKNYVSVDGVLFNVEKTKIVAFPTGRTGLYSIPGTVTDIGQAFEGCNLSSVVIPNSITIIPDDAFYGCPALTSVTIPDSVTSIGPDAFCGCNLKSVTVPASVEYIGTSAFAGSVESITILNPDCTIEDSSTKIEGATLGHPGGVTTVHGYAGSTAEAYAKEWNYTFEALEPTPTPAPTATPEPEDIVVVPEASDTTHVLYSGETVTIYCTGEVKDFIRLWVDDAVVDPRYYTVEEGSTVLTLVSDYLDTLSVGDHPATLEYTTGEADTTITILPRETPAPAPTAAPTQAPSQPSRPVQPAAPQAPTVTCAVRLVNATGDPLTNTRLELRSTPMSGTTNGGGEAPFSSVEFGEHTLSVLDTEGKPSASLQFKLVSGQPTGVDGSTITARPGATVRMTVQYDGTALTILSVEDSSPDTGDNTPVEACVALMGTLSMAACAAYLAWRRGRNRT